MKNPFKISDVVYHATHGKGVVEGTNMPNHVKENDRTILVRFENSLMAGVNSLRQYAATELSFKPWPAPCHERPVEDGWWICTEKASRNPVPLIREVVKGQTEFPVGSSVVKSSLHVWDFHRYLGKDWK